MTRTRHHRGPLAADDIRRDQPRFQGDNLAANLRLVHLLRALATGMGCTPAQLAIAWMPAQPDTVIPLPGMRRRAHLAENLGALTLRLSPEQMEAIGETIPEASGARAPDLSRLEQ